MRNINIKSILENVLNSLEIGEKDLDNFQVSKTLSAAIKYKTNEKLLKKLQVFKQEDNWYQQQVINKINTTISNKSSMLIMAPTGFGKSYIIREESKKFLKKGKSIFIIVPTKELITDYVFEFEKQTIDFIPRQFIKKDFLKEPNIFVLTQERFVNFFGINEEIKANNFILIVDEAFELDFIDGKLIYNKKNERWKLKDNNLLERQETLLKTIIFAQKNKMPILGFSPSISQQKNASISARIKYAFDQSYSIFFKPTWKKYYYFDTKFSDKDIDVNLLSDDTYPKNIEPKQIKDVLKNRALFYISKNQIIGEKRQYRHILKMYSNNESTNDIKEEITKIKDYYGDKLSEKDNLYLEALKHKIGIIIGDTPRKIRLIFKQLFETKKIWAILANQTIIQGVNLNIEYLVLATSRTNDKRAEDRKIANLFGRVGRKHGQCGHVFILKVDRLEDIKKVALMVEQQNLPKNDELTPKNSPKVVKDKVIDKLNKNMTDKFREELQKYKNNKTSLKEIKLPNNMLYNTYIVEENKRIEISIESNDKSLYSSTKKVSKFLTLLIKKEINIKNINDLRNKIDDFKIRLEEEIKLIKQDYHPYDDMKFIDNQGYDFKQQVFFDSVFSKISEYESDIYDEEIQYLIHDNIDILFLKDKNAFIKFIEKELKR